MNSHSQRPKSMTKKEVELFCNLSDIYEQPSDHSAQIMVDYKFINQMKNQGLTNHIKFRTKYWQQKQGMQQQFDQFMEGTFVKGSKVKETKMSKISKDKQKRSYSIERAKPIIETVNTSDSKQLKSQPTANPTNKMNLKLRLIGLATDGFSTISSRLATSQKKQIVNQNRYTGKIPYAKQLMRKRPATSLTIQLQNFSQRSSLHYQHLQLHQVQRHSFFLPLHSSRYSRNHQSV